MKTFLKENIRHYSCSKLQYETNKKNKGSKYLFMFQKKILKKLKDVAIQKRDLLKIVKEIKKIPK